MNHYFYLTYKAYNAVTGKTYKQEILNRMVKKGIKF